MSTQNRNPQNQLIFTKHASLNWNKHDVEFLAPRFPEWASCYQVVPNRGHVGEQCDAQQRLRPPAADSRREAKQRLAQHPRPCAVAPDGTDFTDGKN